MKYSGNRFVGAVAVLVVAFVLFIPSLGNEFVWDDVAAMKKSFRYRSFDVGRISAEKKTYFRPVHKLSYVMDYTLWGENPFGFHLTNVFLYAVCSLLVYLLVLEMLSDFGIRAREQIALFGGLYFAVHPMHVESVSWVSGRTDMLATLFFLIAFLFHMKSKRNIHLVPIAVFAFVLSLLSKELAVCFPFVVLVYDLIKDRSLDKGNMFRFFLYFGILVFYLYLRGWGTTGSGVGETASIAEGALTNVPGHGKNIVSSLVTLLGAYLFYFYKLIFPFTFDSFITRVPSGILVITFSIGVFFSLALFLVRSLRSGNTLPAFILAFILLTLGPSVLVSVIPVASTPLAERYLFLPVAGWAMLVGYVGGALVASKRPPGSWVLLAVVLFLSVHAWFSLGRQQVWRDRITFWADASHGVSDVALPHLNYGIALVDYGRVEEGIRELEYSLKPGVVATLRQRAFAANNLGIAYVKKGDLDRAEEWFQKGVSFDPGFHKSYFHLGLIYYSQAIDTGSREALARAENYFLKTLQIKKNYSRPYLLLAKLYLGKGDLKKAKNYARRAMEYGLERPLEKEARAILLR